MRKVYKKGSLPRLWQAFGLFFFLEAVKEGHISILADFCAFHAIGKLGTGHGLVLQQELDNLVQQYGSHRFVMGSTAGCISAGALGMIYMGRFSQEDKENILGGNWLRLQEGIKWES